jgi:MFS family permease
MVLWVAVLPAIISVALLAGVREPEAHLNQADKAPPLSFSSARRLQSGYWIIVTLGAIFTLARFSEAFLVLRAQSVGLPIGFVPMIMIVMNVLYAASAYPAGIASDYLSQRMMLFAGLAMLVLADLVLAFAGTPWEVFVGAGIWGLHMGFTQGLLNKLVAASAPAELRGSAFGIFNLVTGFALFVASVVAGSMWDLFGPSATFIAGAILAVLAAIGILVGKENPGFA